ncbi:MAG: extracellular catalytic domain type 1 short-chain-length polyhydroxyalkanoate depolymerase [Burkholderiaceae bacterium]
MSVAHKNISRLLCLFIFVTNVVAANTSLAATKPGEWTKDENSYGLGGLYLYLPKNSVPKLAGKRALMVVLHGCAQSASGDIIDKRSGWEVPAEKYGMVLAAPDVPTTNPNGTRVAAGCWDWFGSKHQRGERDTALLADMITAVKARPELNIDPNQIYVVGMSSGGGVSQLLACTYPELIAGFGIHSGPAMGSLVFDVFNAPRVSAESIADNCKRYAGDQQSALSSQIASIIHGELDKLAVPSHADRNREGLQLLYGANIDAGTIEETNQSNGKLYKDTNGKIRLAQIVVTGIGHTFSAGEGSTGGGTYGTNFHDYTHINYPAWVTKFFFDNNLRVKRQP